MTVIKLPKIKADVTKATLYTNSDKAFTANLTTTSKTGSNAIERIELSDDRFNVDFVPNEITPSNGKVTISLSNTVNVEKGKYTLTCKVYYKSGAAGDINPATVKFTVTVK
jgi:5-hydroxyisourate hydrolase-like protein (transthyretin family)